MRLAGRERDAIMNKNMSIYAAYRGDRYIGEGTLSELAKVLNVKRKTLVWARTPTGRKRAEQIEAHRKNRSKGEIHLVLLEER